RRQSRIVPVAPAVAGAAIQVRAARWTQAPTLVAAERLHRQRQVELLAHQLSEIDRLILVERRREVFILDLAFTLTDVRGLRMINEIERRIDRPQERLETPAARQLENRLHPSGQ